MGWVEKINTKMGFFSSYLDIALRSSAEYKVALCFVSLLTIYVTHWLYRWSNPKCNGLLPPGSMGLPFIGEALQLVMPNASIDLPPFIKKRIAKYGTIFRTNVAGKPVIVSADPEFNYFILNQIGKLVDVWSPDTFKEMLKMDVKSSEVIKYIRDLSLRHFGVEAVRTRLLPQMEVVVSETLESWSKADSVELKSKSIEMTISFSIRQILSADLDNTPVKLGELFTEIVEGLMYVPMNVPGTAHHRCVKIQKEVKKALLEVVKKRRMSPKKNGENEDLLDELINDMNAKKADTEDYLVELMFGILFVSSDSISTAVALAFKFLADYPAVLEKLTAEHQGILKNRQGLQSGISWDEYKSMTYTRQVINEVLRMANIAPGLLRQAITDIPVNGYTIPKGWIILAATSAVHLNSDDYPDPLVFNPDRWKDLSSAVVQKCFMPFGVGKKQCSGSEYSRVFIATFLHVLVTRYKWGIVKGGKITRAPILRFPEGFHYNISEKTSVA